MRTSMSKCLSEDSQKHSGCPLKSNLIFITTILAIIVSLANMDYFSRTALNGTSTTSSSLVDSSFWLENTYRLSIYTVFISLKSGYRRNIAPTYWRKRFLEFRIFSNRTSFFYTHYTFSATGII